MAPQLVTRIQRRVAIKSSWLDPPQFGEWFFDPNISAAPEDLHHAWREGTFFSKFAFRFVASLGKCSCSFQNPSDSYHVDLRATACRLFTATPLLTR